MPSPRLPELTPQQSRDAHGLLGWNGLDLAREAGVEAHVLARFERPARRHPPVLIDLAVVRRALEEAGVEFAASGPRMRAEPAAGASAIGAATHHPMEELTLARSVAWRLAARHLRRGAAGRGDARAALGDAGYPAEEAQRIIATMVAQGDLVGTPGRLQRVVGRVGGR